MCPWECVFAVLCLLGESCTVWHSAGSSTRAHEVSNRFPNRPGLMTQSDLVLGLERYVLQNLEKLSGRLLYCVFSIWLSRRTWNLNCKFISWTWQFTDTMSARAISEASGKRLLNEQLGVETGAGTCRLISQVYRFAPWRAKISFKWQ